MSVEHNIPANEFNHAPAGELPHLGPLVDLASELYRRAAAGEKFPVPGITATFHDGHAVFTQTKSPTRYAALDIFHDNQMGGWYVTEEQQLPNVEGEIGTVVRERKAFPLNPIEPTTTEKAAGYPSSLGFRPTQQEVEFGGPITDSACANLIESLRAASGEYPTVQPRAPRRKGWLRKLWPF